MAHRRSGSAVFEYLHQIGWNPQGLYLAGVGVDAQEARSFREDWPSAEIVGFEPNPVSFAGLKPTFPGRLEPIALSDSVGEKYLYFHHSWKNGSSLHKPHESSSRLQIEKVQTITLDNLNTPREALLWLDCEGEEYRILQYAGNFLKGVQAINIEMTGRPRGDGWAKPYEVHELLSEAGFLQAYVHSIRTIRGQYDAIYLKREIFKPEMCAIGASIGEFLKGGYDQNPQS